jgi:hypothetical protein
MASIPRVFHFVYGLRQQDEPFPLMHYLCLKSCIAVNAPDRIDFHTWNMPWGPWWERIEPLLNVRRVEPTRFIDSNPAYRTNPEGIFIRRQELDYAHHADFIRLEVLLEEGGVYADIDTLFVEPIPDDFFHYAFVMAHEGYETTLPDGESINTLCNALMMSQAEAEFAQSWYERMYAVFDGSWNRHSCLEAGVLARERPDALTIVPQRHFFAIPPTADGIARLFDPSDEQLSKINSLHLWEHLWASPARLDFSSFHAGLLTPDYVLAGTSIYARLAARFLLDDDLDQLPSRPFNG